MAWRGQPGRSGVGWTWAWAARAALTGRAPRRRAPQQIKSSSRYQERLKQLLAEEFKVGVKKSGGSAKSKGLKGDKAEEAKQAAEEMLHEELISKLVQPPKYQDTLAWQIFVMPLTVYYSGQTNFSWFMRFKVKGEAYGPEEASTRARPPPLAQLVACALCSHPSLAPERAVPTPFPLLGQMAYLTYTALKIPEAEWNMMTEKEQQECLALELWDKANLKAYEAEQNSATSPKSAKQKREERQAKRRTGKFVMDD